MSRTINTMTIDPVTPEQIEAGMARGRKERAEMFRALVAALLPAAWSGAPQYTTRTAPTSLPCVN